MYGARFQGASRHGPRVVRGASRFRGGGKGVGSERQSSYGAGGQQEGLSAAGQRTASKRTAHQSLHALKLLQRAWNHLKVYLWFYCLHRN